MQFLQMEIGSFKGKNPAESMNSNPKLAWFVNIVKNVCFRTKILSIKLNFYPEYSNIINTCQVLCPGLDFHLDSCSAPMPDLARFISNASQFFYITEYRGRFVFMLPVTRKFLQRLMLLYIMVFLNRQLSPPDTLHPVSGDKNEEILQALASMFCCVADPKYHFVSRKIFLEQRNYLSVTSRNSGYFKKKIILLQDDFLISIKITLSNLSTNVRMYREDCHKKILN